MTVRHDIESNTAANNHMMNAAAQEVVPHGRFIYAYCNVRTNQVLYSLSRNLDNSALKQLPDLGANHTPPVLRKDIWRPLYRVELPSTPDGAKQGLHCFKKLREYRKLHELSWEPSILMTRNFTPKEIEQEKKKLENRGGSKKESVYDIIKRQKHKMKVKMVMDQKANSIADLAAVLLEQEELGVKTTEAKQIRARNRVTGQIEEMTRLAQEAEIGGIEKMENKRDMLLNTLKQMRKDGATGQRQKLRREIDSAERRLLKMRSVHEVAKEVKREIERLAEEERKGGSEKITNLIDGLREMQRGTTLRINRLRNHPKESLEGEIGNLGEKIVGLEKEMKGLEEEIKVAEQKQRDMRAAKAAMEAKASSAPTDQGASEKAWLIANRKEELLSIAEKYGPTVRQPSHARRKLERRSTPIFAAEGITVKWANIMDLEYAASWPDSVQHARMGFTTRNFPLVDTETVAEYRALQWKKRRENLQLEEGTAEKVERIRAEMGLQARGDQIEGPVSGFVPAGDPSDVKLANGEAEGGETEARQKTARNVVVNDPRKLENIHGKIMSKIKERAAQESWDKRAELDMRIATNRYQPAPLPNDVSVKQQPTA